VVDLFALGSDSDGYIDPLDKYPSVLEFSKLKSDLIEVVEQEDDEMKGKLLNGLDVAEFAEKVCFDNAYQFALKNMA
jgi:hypothetical protein